MEFFVAGVVGEDAVVEFFDDARAGFAGIEFIDVIFDGFFEDILEFASLILGDFFDEGEECLV